MIAVLFSLFFGALLSGALLWGIDQMMRDYPDYKGEDFLNDDK